MRYLCALLALLIGTSAQAAWTFRGAGAATGNGSNVALTPGAPSGVQVNDVVLLATGSRGAGQTLTISGWDEIASLTTDRSDKVFCRVWQSGDSMPTLDWSSTTYQSAAAVAFYGGASSCSDIVLHIGTAGSSGSTSQPLADATITTANTLVLFVAFKSKTSTSDGLTLAPPGGVTEAVESWPNGVANQGLWIGYQIQTTATSISGLSLTQTGTTESTQRQAFTLALSAGGAPAGPGSPPVGKDDIVVASIASSTWCTDFNSAATPDIAVGDTIRIDEVTSPGGFALTHGTDCALEYSGDDSRQIVEYDVYDDSAAGWMTGGPGLLVINNQSPACSGPQDLFLNVDEAMTVIALTGICSDVESDALTCALTSGTLPTGLSLGGAGNCTLSGTPTVENEAGAAVTFTVTDPYGATATQDYRIVPVDTVTVADCTTSTTSMISCAESIESAGFLEASASFACSVSVAAGNVISQSPSASAEVEPFTSVSLVVSRGACPVVRRTGIGAGVR